MNTGLIFILIVLALCELCFSRGVRRNLREKRLKQNEGFNGEIASQTSHEVNTGRIMEPTKKCESDDKASKEYNYFSLTYDDLDVTMKIYQRLKEEKPDDSILQKNAERMIGYLKNVKTLSKRISLDVTTLLNDDKNEVDCDFQMDVVKALRKLNYWREKNLLSIGLTFQDLFDCFGNNDDDEATNCRLKYVASTDNMGSVEVAKINDFISKFSVLEDKYYQVMEKYDLIYLNVIWFKTFRVKLIELAKSIQMQLEEIFEPIESGLDDIVRRIKETDSDVEDTKNFIKALNNEAIAKTSIPEDLSDSSGDGELDHNSISNNLPTVQNEFGLSNNPSLSASAVVQFDRIDLYLPIIETAETELDGVANELTSTVVKLRKLQDKIDSVYRPEIQFSTKLSYSYSYDHELSPREKIVSMEAGSIKFFKRIADVIIKLDATRVVVKKENHPEPLLQDTFKRLNNVFLEFDKNSVVYTLCSKGIVDAMRPIIQLGSTQNVQYSSKSHSDASFVDYIFKKHKNFSNKLSKFFSHQMTYSDELVNYISALHSEDWEVAARARIPNFTGLFPNSEELALFVRILRIFISSVAVLQNKQCELSKKIIYGQLSLNSESLQGPYRALFRNDDMVESTLRNTNKESLAAYMKSEMQQNMTNLNLINSKFDALMEFYNQGCKQFYTYRRDNRRCDILEDTADEMTLLQTNILEIYSDTSPSGAPTMQLRSAGSGVTNPNEIVDHTGRALLESSLSYFDQIFAVGVDDEKLSKKETVMFTSGEYGDGHVRLLGAENSYLQPNTNAAVAARFRMSSNPAPEAIYVFDSDKYLLQYSGCGEQCLYRVELRHLENALVLVAFGRIEYNKDKKAYLPIIYYIQTMVPITEDRRDFFASICTPANTIQFMSLDKTRTAPMAPFEYTSAVEVSDYSLFIGVTGTVDILVQKVNAVVLVLPLLGSSRDHERHRDAAYKHYQLNYSRGFNYETNFYVKKGLGRDLNVEESYFSIPMLSGNFCTAVGFVQNQIDIFRQIIHRGYYFNGQHVVTNPYYACHGFEHSSQGLILDNASTPSGTDLDPQQLPMAPTPPSKTFNVDTTTGEELPVNSPRSEARPHKGVSLQTQVDSRATTTGTVLDDEVEGGSPTTRTNSRLPTESSLEVEVEFPTLIISHRVETEVLTVRQVRRSTNEAQITKHTMKFFVLGAEFYYDFTTHVDTRFVPGYIYQKLPESEIENSLKILKLETAPNLPITPKHLCENDEICKQFNGQPTCKFDEDRPWVLGECVAA